MPEHDQEKRRLPGEIIVTTSSDEAISATLNGLRREIQGLPNPEVIIEGDQLEPKTLTPSSSNQTEPVIQTGTSKISTVKPTDSALGHFLRSVRLLKKAA